VQQRLGLINEIMNVNSWMVLNPTIVTKEMANDWKAWCGNRTVVRESSIGELYICAVKLDIQNFEQTQLFYSASYFNLGEGIGALFRRG